MLLVVVTTLMAATEKVLHINITTVKIKRFIMNSQFLSSLPLIKGRGRVGFCVTAINPHPSPLPQGEGVSIKFSLLKGES
jgi:hypothetical protein